MPFPKGVRENGFCTEAADGHFACGVCGEEIDKGEDEYILGHCSKCGTCPYHGDCVADLQARAETHNSKSREKMLVRAKHHPDQMLVRMRCPCGLREGKEQCNGKIVQADMVRPVKAPPSPVPALPPRAPPQQQQQQQQPGPCAAPPPPKKAPPPKKGPAFKVLNKTPSSSSILSSAGGASDWSTVGAGARARVGASPSLKGGGRGDAKREIPGLPPSRSEPGGGGGGKGPGGSSLRFGPGQRPAHLQMCDNWCDYGECRIYNCEYCHGEEELAQREKAYRAEQEEKQRKERQAALQEHKCRAAAAGPAASAALPPPGGAWARGGLAAAAPGGGGGGGGTRWAFSGGTVGAGAGVAGGGGRGGSGGDVEEAFLQLSEALLGLMRVHKRRNCINFLLEMGFDDASAQGAASATGCDVSAAVQLLMEGGVYTGAPPKPINVTGEAQTLLAMARELGRSMQDVEMELVMSHGNWEAAAEALEAQALGGPTRASAAALSANTTTSATHPQQQGPHWPEAPTPIPLSPTPSQAANLSALLPPGTDASSAPTPRSSSVAGSTVDGWAPASVSAQQSVGGGQWPAPEELSPREGAPEWATFGAPGGGHDGGMGPPPADFAELSAASEGFLSRFGGLSLARQEGAGAGGAAHAPQSVLEHDPWAVLAASHAAAPAASSAQQVQHKDGWALGGFSQGLAPGTAATATGAPATSLASAAGGVLGGSTGYGSHALAGADFLGAAAAAVAGTAGALSSSAHLQSQPPYSTTPHATPLGPSQHPSQSSLFDLPPAFPYTSASGPAATANPGLAAQQYQQAAQYEQQQYQGHQPQYQEPVQHPHHQYQEQHYQAQQYPQQQQQQQGQSYYTAPPAAAAAASPPASFDDGYRPGLSAAAAVLQSSLGGASLGGGVQQAQQLTSYPQHALDSSSACLAASAAAPAGYAAGYTAGGAYAAAAAAAPHAAAGQAQQGLSWRELLREGGGGCGGGQATAAVGGAGKGAISLWGQQAPASAGGVAEDEAELQDMLSLLCT